MFWGMCAASVGYQLWLVVGWHIECGCLRPYFVLCAPPLFLLEVFGGRSAVSGSLGALLVLMALFLGFLMAAVVAAGRGRVWLC